MSKISIIIPILNEAKTIGKLLQYLIDNISKKNSLEIIVIDGGSSDNSKEIIQTFCKKEKGFESSSRLQGHLIKLITSSKGRAKQMNLGAKQARGNILYFLHADSFPPKNFDQLIVNEVEKGNLAGCFRMQFENTHLWLQLAGWLTQFRWRACRGGDQSQFITKELFDDIGGFDNNYIIYEDNILINELYKRNEFVVINKKLKTSARRYEEHGVWKLQYHFWTIYVKKMFGASANELHIYYKKYIT